MGIMLEAGYHIGTSGNYTSVPSPHDGDKNTPWFWDFLAANAKDLRLSGITSILLPPVTKAQGGAGKGCDGYGVYDDYDIGSKNQQFSTETRFGSRERLQRLVAILRANGIDVYVDMVPHQRMGGNNGVYRYASATGATNGRFHKDPGCFLGYGGGRVPRDPIAGPAEFDYAFGDELCPVNAKPQGYVMNGLTDAGDWLTRSLDIQGYRVDDTKGLAVQYVSHWLNSKAMAGKFAVGEYFDGNADTLDWWVWKSGMNGRCATFDFSIRFPLHDMCNNNSNWDMRQLTNAGRYFNRRDPMSSVTFVDNHDTDTSSPVIWNKMMAYAYILTSEGYPCVFAKDYFVGGACYGLKHLIDNLAWIHENLAFGPTADRFADYQAYVYERLGSPGLLVGLNNDQYNGWRTITVQTNFGANVQLHDYTGRTHDIWTDGQGRATMSIPPNVNGRGYVAYSRTGYGQAFSNNGYDTTQVFFGADDLDIGPATTTGSNIGRIWCAAGTTVHINVRTPGVTVTVLEGAKVDKTGWRTLIAKSDVGDKSFEVSVTYRAPQTL